MFNEKGRHLYVLEPEHWVPNSLSLEGVEVWPSSEPRCPHSENRNDLHFTRFEEKTCNVLRKLLSTLLVYVLSLKHLSLFPALGVFSFAMSFSVHPFPLLLGPLWPSLHHLMFALLSMASWLAIFLSFLLLGALWPTKSSHNLSHLVGCWHDPLAESSWNLHGWLSVIWF